MTTSDSLKVWFDDHLIGTITRQGKVQMRFSYERSWLQEADAFPLSLSLPLREKSFSWEETRAFFDNLLPEGQVRETIGRNLRISERNVYALLEELGQECAGALSILPAGESPRPSSESGYRRLSRADLELILIKLSRRPLLAGEDELRMSLAGAQPKLPIAQDGKSFLLPLGGVPSTHILKPPIDDLLESVENETFCMLLARAMGLRIPDVQITDTRPRGYVVRRYDRNESQEGVRRVHQEDFCQALGMPPEVKYERDGGPGLDDCFGVLDKCVDSAADKRQLLLWCLFNYHIGNADAHAKNISLLYDSTEGPRLAPFYDIICTAVYPELATRLAMKIGGRYDTEYIRKRHWERLGLSAGLRPEDTVAFVVEFLRKMTSLCGPVERYYHKRFGDSPLVGRIVALARKRCAQSLERIAADSS